MEFHNDEEILNLYFARNPLAVNYTADNYGGKLTRFATGMVDYEDALECVNDTYVAAWDKIPPERPNKFLAWLYRVCRNIVCDRIDWNHADKRYRGVNVLLDELAECVVDANASYEGEMSDLGRAISDFLKSLDEGKRVLFVRRYWYGLSVSELAGTSGLSESNVKTTLYRLRNELKKYLSEEGFSL